jgi:uncharacterized membrane protein
MTWRGSVTIGDRLLAVLPYIFTLLDGVMFGVKLMKKIPALQLIYVPLEPIAQLYLGNRLVGFAVFLALYFLVVRNENIPHFIRFNTMQAIMIGIVLSLCGIMFYYIVDPIFGSLSSGFVKDTLYNTVFLGMLASVFYSVVQTLRGAYAEIPTLSDAVHMQVR